MKKPTSSTGRMTGARAGGMLTPQPKKQTQPASIPATSAALPVHPVHHPAHYTQGPVEYIDAIASALGRDGFIAFLRGQVIKYQWRMLRKDATLQDAQKAHWYSAKLIDTLQS